MVCLWFISIFFFFFPASFLFLKISQTLRALDRRRLAVGARYLSCIWHDLFSVKASRFPHSSPKMSRRTKTRDSKQGQFTQLSSFIASTATVFILVFENIKMNAKTSLPSPDCRRVRPTEVQMTLKCYVYITLKLCVYYTHIYTHIF